MGNGSGSGSGSAVPPDRPVPYLDPQILALGAKLKADLEKERIERRQREAKASADAIRKKAEDGAKLQQEVDRKLGRVNPAVGMAVAKLARSLENSREWAMFAVKEPYGKMGGNKCNLFVYDVMSAVGVPVPLSPREPLGTVPLPPIPPVTGEWSNPNFKMDHWEVVYTPRPGDVVVTPPEAGDRQGHMGIVLENNQTVWASSTQHKVVVGTWGLEPEQKGRVVFRRYVP